MSFLIRPIILAATVLLVGLTSCGRDVTDPTGTECNPDTGSGCEPPATAVCDPQQVPAGRSCVRWTPVADGFRHVNAADTFDILVIDAGTDVRAAADVPLVMSRLHIDGTATSPVSFAPAVEGERWGGIRIIGSDADTSGIRYARIVSASAGIAASSPVMIADTHVEDITGVGVFLRGGRLDRSLITGAQAAGVAIGSNSFARMSDTDVRDSGDGITVECLRCYLLIGGGSIVDNAGDGVRTWFGDVLGGTVIFESPVRITGNGGYPLVVPLVSMRGVMSDVDARGNLLGNAYDTIIAFTGSTWGAQHVPAGSLSIARELPFRVEVPCTSALPLMTMEAGASLTVESYGCGAGPAVQWPVPISLGTPTDPVRIRGVQARLGLVRQGADTVFVRHARITGVRLASSSTPVVIEDVELDSSSLAIHSSGSRVTRVRSSDGGTTGEYEYQQEAAITLGADVRLEQVLIERALHHGLHVAGGSSTSSDCTIRRNAAHGVWVEQGTIRIEQCSLEDNAGYGIHNSTPDTVPARHNWWGDPMGPRGSAGDGLDGPVWYQPFLIAPPAALRSAFCVRLEPCEVGEQLQHILAGHLRQDAWTAGGTGGRNHGS